MDDIFVAVLKQDYHKMFRTDIKYMHKYNNVQCIVPFHKTSIPCNANSKEAKSCLDILVHYLFIH